MITQPLLFEEKTYTISGNGYTSLIVNGEEIYPFYNGWRKAFNYHNEICIKVDTDNNPYSTGNQCRLEYEAWNKIKNDKNYSRFFVPVLYHGTLSNGHDYNVMPFINFKKDMQYNHSDVAILLVRDVAKKFNFCDIAGNTSNWIEYSTGMIKIYDYSF